MTEKKDVPMTFRLPEAVHSRWADYVHRQRPKSGNKVFREMVEERLRPGPQLVAPKIEAADVGPASNAELLFLRKALTAYRYGNLPGELNSGLLEMLILQVESMAKGYRDSGAGVGGSDAK